jgi:two-component system, cell cycle sensor histidine kinase and response regulator CckA
MNARDAMPAGGAIDVAIDNTTLDAEDARRMPYVVPGDYVRLAVADQGVGMDAETRAHVFEPFFTTKTGRGTGLGLSTAYAIVKGARGYIWVHSLDRGTRVEVVLPRADAAPRAKPAPSGAESGDGRDAATSSEQTAPAKPRTGVRPWTGRAAGRQTIVLVEDEEPVRTIVRRTLESRGYHVIAAADGEEALELCMAHEGPIDLLVTDIVMPGLSGREVAERIETLRPGTRTLFMSGYTADEIIRRGIMTEAIAFIEKPFAPSQLVARIRETLEKRE